MRHSKNSSKAVELVVRLLIAAAMAVAGPLDTHSQSGTQGRSLVFQEHDPALSQYGAVNSDARWDRNAISVCWLDHPELSRQRQLVRQAVADTWMHASSIRFTGWGDCSQAGADLRIRVDESGPRSYVGRNVIGQSPSMWLNFTFNSWSTDCKAAADNCIRSIAAHEFGHAAGFEHEQLQVDAPKKCVDHLKATGQWEKVGKPPTALTPYDPNSIMNYCNAIWNNNGTLSGNDIVAIRILFPVT
jgi:hypothetical protein